ncbi:sterol 3-beta-glucosyltransferase [Rhypophila sp. PSN 637]
MAGATPPTATSSSIRLETTLKNDQPVTVARDAEGNIVYPSYVPQSTTSPTASPSAPGQFHEPDYNPPRKSRSEPLPSSSTSSRPKARNWATEKQTAKDRRTMARVGTTLSALNPTRRHHPHHDGADDTSSSDESSSSSEEEEEEEESHHRTRQRKRAATEGHYDRFHVKNQNYKTKGKVSKRDGRLSISVKDMSNTGYLAKALGMAVKKVMPGATDDEAGQTQPLSVVSTLSKAPVPDALPCPKLNIVIMVIGSRGDAQPFLKIGKVLKETYGHRVRIATHPAFRDFVENDSGLEFFSVGGDPSELMAFMVKNPGMIPSLETVKAGDIGRRRAAMAEMFGGFWRACINATDDEKDVRNVKMMGRQDPFVADAIIANPPSFAHIHCAEALGIPLHLMFTFPYTPTQSFPHPLASIKKSNVDPGYTNFISYPLVEMMVWQGLGDLVNDFRVKTLGLDPVSTLWAPGATYRLKVPFTYLWSPGLVPKPEDWGSEVDIAGFTFLDLASTFKPPDDLARFMEDSDDPPVYIGFGSIVVDDPNKFTKMIFEAVKKAGVRALVSKGWGGLGGDSMDVPDGVFMLDNTPHDWLFPKVRACVIHGGAGTTAIALKCGKPTMIVPFFGDQHFWGSMVANVNAGPEPIPYKELTADKLAEGIKYCLGEEANKGAQKIARDIEAEGDGAENACRAFHNNLILTGKNSMRCSILEDHVAVWQLKDTSLRLSPIAANIAEKMGYVSWKKLRLLRHNEWNDFEGPGEPVTGAAGSLMGTLGGVFGGVGGVPFRVAKNREKRKEKKERRRRREEKRRAEKQEEVEEQNGNAAGGHKEETTTSDKPAYARRDTQLTASTTGGVPDNPVENVTQEVGRGAKKTAAALARAPVDLSVALAQGFHNAPRLYGDDTVRRPTRVTGMRSGLRAARHEFAYGIYDGWTGVVKLPIRGAKENGIGGFARGVGMGLTGFVLKDLAALIGPVGYTLKGVVKELEHNQEKINQGKIRKARLVQGMRELEGLKPEEVKQREHLVVAGMDLMNELWIVLEEAEKGKSKSKKGGLTRGRKGQKGKRRGQSAAFESVRTAKEALALLERDPELGLKAVLGVAKKEVEEKEGERKKHWWSRSKKDGQKKKGGKKINTERMKEKDFIAVSENGNGILNGNGHATGARVPVVDEGEAGKGGETEATVEGENMHEGKGIPEVPSSKARKEVEAESGIGDGAGGEGPGERSQNMDRKGQEQK